MSFKELISVAESNLRLGSTLRDFNGYPCDICQQEFRTKLSLVHHKRTGHPIRMVENHEVTVGKPQKVLQQKRKLRKHVEKRRTIVTVLL